MKTNTNKKHIINPEEMGVKKINNSTGYDIKNFTRITRAKYWGDYCVMVTNLGFEVLTSVYGSHEPIHTYRPC